MRQTVRRLFIAFALALIYLFVLPVGTGTELLMVRNTAVAIAATAEADSTNEQLVPIVLGSRFAYLDSTGRPIAGGRIAYGIAADSLGYVNYPQRPDSLVLQSADGGFLASLPGNAYPALRNDAVLTVGSNQQTLTRYTSEGVSLWSYDAGAPITTLAAGRDLVVAGTLAGVIVGIGAAGQEVLRAAPTGSEVSAVYGVAATRDDERLAALCGLRPRQLFIFERVEGEYVPVFRADVDGDARRAVFIEFVGPELLITETPDGALVVDNQSGRVAGVPMGAPILSAGWAPSLDVLVGMSEPAEPQAPAGSSRLVIATPEGRIMVSVPWAGRHRDLQVRDTLLYAGFDQTVVQIGLGEG